jgi:hypothetical protein
MRIYNNIKRERERERERKREREAHTQVTIDIKVSAGFKPITGLVTHYWGANLPPVRKREICIRDYIGESLNGPNHMCYFGRFQGSATNLTKLTRCVIARVRTYSMYPVGIHV